ncbi:hypothetical protein F7725_027178 [Dissostichus mawsoni]|uniref:Uncharacterized protein n=1 Tax=Dissostichus mawsoni TaxID=36200 RepID=A0A7J5XC84_DISMA|nr:hypothetical protein F7725_027178 [Dissostichus mawsoni]
MAFASRLRSALRPGNRALAEGEGTLRRDRTAAGLMLARGGCKGREEEERRGEEEEEERGGRRGEVMGRWRSNKR